MPCALKKKKKTFVVRWAGRAWGIWIETLCDAVFKYRVLRIERGLVWGAGSNMQIMCLGSEG